MNKIWLVAILALMFGVVGCAGSNWNIPSGNNAMLTAIELGGYNLGYYVGQSNSVSDDQAIADAYALARTGTLSPKQVAQAFVAFKIQNPQLAGSLMIVLTNMGATVSPENGLLSLSGIPIEYWDRAAKGYAAGYEFGKLNQKAARKSAILKHLPKN